MNISTSNTKKRFEKQVNNASLPFTLESEPSRGTGIVILILSALWLTPAFAALYATLTNTFPAFELARDPVFISISVISGIAMVVLGLYIMITEEAIVIDETTVSLDRKSLFKNTVWEEPLKNYEGVLQRSEYHSGGRNSTSYTLYIVELYHPDKKKTLTLYKSRKGHDFRNVWEDYSRLLNLPAMVKDGDRVFKRDAQDLDKSVKDLASEGKIEVKFDPSTPPPKGVQTSLQHGAVTIRLPKRGLKKPDLIGGSVFIILPVIFIHIGFFKEDNTIVFGLLGVAFLLAVITAYVWKLITEEEIVVSPQEIRFYYDTPWGNTNGIILNSAAIETVRIGKDTDDRSGLDGLLIITDDQKLKLGEGLPEDTLTWLKQCVLAVITR